ncbi:uncharacterized protein B4U79_01445, partial [Dinothrombium tinctorium]
IDCTHNIEERKLIGTWTTIEINLAKEKGYKILEVYEINHYSKRSTTMFKEYIRMWLKIKQESSGWPEWCRSEDDKTRYIDLYEERMGIKLDQEKIVKNQALRSTAKLMLNVLWGKLGQNPDKTQVELCNDFCPYWKLLTNENLRITSEIEINEKTMLVTYKYSDLNKKGPGNTSFANAALVTAHARIKLYKEIDKIEHDEPGRVLYFDTDSIIFWTRKISDQYKPLLGDYLGDMTDEIAGEYGSGAKITRFITGGPKNYGYTVRTQEGKIKTIMKIKGLRLNIGTLNILQFEKMIDAVKDYVLNGNTIEIRVPQFNIYSDKEQNVFSRKFQKIYRVVSEKRKIIKNSTLTEPYGYVEPKIERQKDRNIEQANNILRFREERRQLLVGRYEALLRQTLERNKRARKEN